MVVNKAIDGLMHMGVDNGARKICQQLHVVHIYESIRNRSYTTIFYLHMKHNEQKLKLKYPLDCNSYLSQLNARCYANLAYILVHGTLVFTL